MSSYEGPVLEVTFAYTEWEQTELMKKSGEPPRRRTRRVVRTARLNNPRKTEESVRLELCRQVKDEYPKSKLQSFRTIVKAAS